MKGFIEVHDSRNENRTVLVNIRHIVEVRGNVIYMDDALPTSTDFPYTALQGWGCSMAHR